MQLTKSLAQAFAGDGIRVNAVAPGWIQTPLLDQVQAVPGMSEAILAPARPVRRPCRHRERHRVPVQ